MIKLIILELKLFYWRQALRQMGGEHPDAPEAIINIRMLLDQKPLDCINRDN